MNIEHALHRGVNLLEGGSEASGGNGPAVDLDALGGLGEMRRSEQAGAAAGGSQSGFDHRAGGAFAIGAGDVDRADAVLGAAERFKHGGDAIEAELGGLDFVAERVKKAYGIGIGHARHRLPRSAAASMRPRLAMHRSLRAATVTERWLIIGD